MGNERRLINFIYNSDIAYVIELGHHYLRFFRDGNLILDGVGDPYVVFTDYESADIFDVKYIQVVNDMYLVHPDYPPSNLTRNADDDWDFTDVPFYRGPFLAENDDDTITVSSSALTGTVTLTASEGIWTSTNVGGLFKIKGDRFEDATISGGGNAFTDPILLDEGGKVIASVTGTWAGTVTLQKSYDEGVTYLDYWQTDGNDNFKAETEQDNVFWRLGIKTGDLDEDIATVRLTERDAYGYGTITAFGSSTSVTLVVEQDFPSTEATDKWSEGAFSERRGYPAAVGFSKQRAIYANTTYRPTTFWGSVIDDYTNFNLGTQADDDSFQFTIASNEVNGLLSFIDQRVLLGFTERNIWKLSALNKTITPTSPAVEKQTGFGANEVQPIIIGNTILYAAAGGQELRTLDYDYAVDSWVSRDISIKSEHLLKDGNIVDMCFSARPDNMIYMVMSTGDIVTCLFDITNNLIAFSKLISTNGEFKSVTAIPNEDDYDEVWAIVRRYVDGNYQWLVERFTNPYWEAQTDYIFTDCTTTVTGTDITTVSGLDYLEGETVSILIDGAQYPDTVVSGGLITINPNYAGDVVHIGLGYTSKVQTMRLNPPTEIGSSLGKQQAVHDVAIIVKDTINCKFGKDDDHLEQLPNFGPPYMGRAPIPYTGIVPETFPYGYDNEQYIMLASDKPLPFTLLGLNITMQASSR